MDNLTLEQKVMTALKDAMKAKDQVALRSLRAIKSALLLAKTDGSKQQIDEALELKILQKLVKQRKESLAIYETQNREDLAAIERDEIAVIEKFLPAQLTDDKLNDILREIIEKTNAQSPADMGKVMGLAMKQLAGKADGKRISEAIKTLLQ